MSLRGQEAAPPYLSREWNDNRNGRLAMAFEDFSQSTTLHGLRYIADRSTFLARRIIWFLLTILCASFLVYQIVERVSYFYSSPITVNFRVNYNQSLAFPTVTICNQNVFRATSAKDRGWYRLIERMFRKGRNGSVDWDDVPGSNLTIDQLFTHLSHRKEDFIIKCEWDGEPCTADNFTQTQTDHGICYSFNKLSGTDPMLYVSSSGVEHGLRLTLNNEGYEAMPGPHETTGIKILATDQSDFPRVEEVGNAISTGTHAYIGLGVLVINNLPEPHGDCGDKELFSTRRYTTEVCTLECITKYIKARCGCRHFYMPNYEGDLPVCTVKAYFNCFTDAHAYIRKRTMEYCNCPTSCNYQIYEPTISYGATSDNIKHQLLSAMSKQELKSRFLEARETTNKMNRNIFLNFNETVERVSKTFDSLKYVLVLDINERLAIQINRLQEVVNNMTKAIEMKTVLYEFQRYCIQKNFMRARDAMEERTLNKVCLGFHEHVFDTEFKLSNLAKAKQNGSSDIDILYLLLKNVLNSKVETTTRAYANYTQLYEAYYNGVKIFNYKFKNYPRKDNPFIVPKPLMNESLHHNKYALRYAPRVGVDIQRVMNSTLKFEDLVDECYDSDTCTINSLDMHGISGEFIDACEDFFHSKSTFYFESVDRPLRIVDLRLSQFETSSFEYTQCRDSLQTALDGLNDSLRHIREQFLGDLTDNILLAKQYFETSGEYNVTKYDLARSFTSDQIRDQLHTMKIFFDDLRQRGNFIYEKWTELKEKCLKIWKIILTDFDTYDYYEYKQIEDFLRNFTDVEETLEEYFLDVREDNDLRYAIGNTDNIFVQAIEELIDDLRSFQASCQMDETFIRDNFVQLDVYFKELRHEQIDQQKAYNVIALLCDIGGSMGLFLGASAMTIFEILDFFANRTAVKVTKQRRKKRKKKQLQLNSVTV